MPRSCSHRSSSGTVTEACGMAGLAMMPTSLMSGIQKKLPVALGAQNRTGDDLGPEAQTFCCFRNALAGCGVQFRIPDNSPFPNLMPFQLELRLYQNYHFSLTGKQDRQRGEDHCDGDEAHIA